MSEGDDDKNWLESLPEELREAPFIGKAASAEEALGKIQHAARYMNRAVVIPDAQTEDEQRAEFYDTLLKAAPDVIRIPEDDADEDTLNAFRSRFGVPEKAEDYTPAEGEDWEWDDAYLGTLRDMAHAAGLNQKQFKQFTKLTMERQLAQDELTAADLHEAQEALKKEWGAALPDRLKTLQNWMKLSDAPADMQKLIEEGNLTVESANWLYSIASEFAKGGKTIAEDDDDTPGALTPVEVREGIQKILNDPDYFDSASPRQKGLKQRMNELQTMVAEAG